MDQIENEIKNQVEESSQIIKSCLNLSTEIQKSIEIIEKCFQEGKKLVIFGNGGSAADAQHIAAEFIGRFKLNRKSLPAISLTTDTSILTSIHNDFSDDIVFSRQCEALVKSRDVVLGISTSGNSLNVLKGLEAAKKNNGITIGLLGNNGGIIKEKCDLTIIVDSESTSLIQEAHRVIYHIICNQIEKKLFNNKIEIEE